MRREAMTIIHNNENSIIQDQSALAQSPDMSNIDHAHIPTPNHSNTLSRRPITQAQTHRQKHSKNEEEEDLQSLNFVQFLMYFFKL